MNRSLIASFAAITVVATPALALTAPAAKPINTSFTHHKKGKVVSANLAKSSLKTSKDKKFD